MPRLDNSDPQVIDEFGLHFDPNDPGATNPIDVCNYCARLWEGEVIFPEHPPYSDDDYTCADCEEKLTDDDNQFHY